MAIHEYPDEYQSTKTSPSPGRRPGNDHRTTPVGNRDPGASIIAPPVIQIPTSLVVTAAAFREFMRKNRLDEVVEDMLAGVDVTRIEEFRQPSARIQETIRLSPLPHQVYDTILQGCRQMGHGETIVWPVTIPFEPFQFSQEYQRYPYLEATGPEGTLEAIKTWWASLFDPAAIFYRRLRGQRHRDARITVAAQRKPDKAFLDSAYT